MCRQTSNKSFFTNVAGYHDSTMGRALSKIAKEVKATKQPTYRLTWKAQS